MEKVVELTDISLKLLELGEEDKKCSLGGLTLIFIDCYLDKKDWLV